MVKKYKVVADDTDIYAVSLVESPAVESNFVFLSKDGNEMSREDKIKLMSREAFSFTYDDKSESPKYMVYGVVLRPDFPIYRYDRETDTEYYIEFSKEAVENLSQKWMSYFIQKDWKVNHDRYVNELCTVESWIKADAVNDKSVALGLNDETVPVGSWIMGLKVNNVEVWEDIKSGKYNGFSVEMYTILDEFEEFAKNNTPNKKEKMEKNSKISELFSKITELFSIYTNDVQKDEPEEAQTEELSKDETKEETKEVQAEELSAEADKSAEETKEAQVEELSKEDTKEDTKEENVELSSMVETLQHKVEELSTENQTLKAQIEALSKQPSVEPLNLGADRITFADIYEMRTR